MTITLSINPEIKGRASSSYTLENIDRRLAELRQRDDEQAREEIAYLERLKAKQ